jgi:hypothetical protein
MSPETADDALSMGIDDIDIDFNGVKDGIIVAYHGRKKGITGRRTL